MAAEKIYVQIDNDKTELTGADKQSFILLQQEITKERALLEAEYKAKQDARESAIKKLAEIAGLTKEELASIL
jgi:hypothetical protein